MNFIAEAIIHLHVTHRHRETLQLDFFFYDYDNDGDPLHHHTLVLYGGSNCEGDGREQERQKKRIVENTVYRFPYKDPVERDEADSEAVEPKRESKASLDPIGPKDANV